MSGSYAIPASDQDAPARKPRSSKSTVGSLPGLLAPPGLSGRGEPRVLTSWAISFTETVPPFFVCMFDF